MKALLGVKNSSKRNTRGFDALILAVSRVFDVNYVMVEIILDGFELSK